MRLLTSLLVILAASGAISIVDATRVQGDLARLGVLCPASEIILQTRPYSPSRANWGAHRLLYTKDDVLAYYENEAPSIHRPGQKPVTRDDQLKMATHILKRIHPGASPVVKVSEPHLVYTLEVKGYRVVDEGHISLDSNGDVRLLKFVHAPSSFTGTVNLTPAGARDKALGYLEHARPDCVNPEQAVALAVASLESHPTTQWTNKGHAWGLGEADSSDYRLGYHFRHRFGHVAVDAETGEFLNGELSLSKQDTLLIRPPATTSNPQVGLALGTLVGVGGGWWLARRMRARNLAGSP